MIDFNKELKDAMLGQQALRLSVLRALKTEITKLLSTKGRKTSASFTQDEEWELIRAQIRQREDSIQSYIAVGAVSAAEKEEAENEILLSFLPEQVTEDELYAIIEDCIDETNSSSKRDTGKVIQRLKEKISVGRFDLKQASRKISERLIS